DPLAAARIGAQVSSQAKAKTIARSAIGRGIFPSLKRVRGMLHPIASAPAWDLGARSVSFSGMDLRLTDIEARVLGALIEKEITTPEYYPLSLNALMNACNQKSNREPVMNLDEDRVRSALRSLSDQHLARSAASDSRVSKYEHRLNEQFNFHRHEIA